MKRSGDEVTVSVPMPELAVKVVSKEPYGIFLSACTTRSMSFIL